MLQEDKGYSIFELVVVISLIGILFLFIVPGFQNFIREGDVSGVSNSIAARIKDLKQRSVIEEKNYYLNYDRDKRVLWTSWEEIDKDVKSYEIEKGINLDEDFLFDFKTSSGESRITFYKQGYSDKASIQISDRVDTIKIIINSFTVKPEIVIL